ncbi:hypothetical protein [Pseudodesulfovibrio karagichevae]|uniref:DUF3168 domain-containing protein n=1 Tax=Pseudodesulfovibrio karagichevae TaxID=3239305 RepID=A0ABV4K5U0_9BACT
MLSIIITKYIAENMPDLTTGKNLFTENSTGNQCVAVITRDLTPWPGMPQSFRKALIEVEVKGYRMAEANALSEAILVLLEGMQSVYETVSIRTVEAKQLPCFQHDGTCTCTFRVFFVEGE